MQIFNSAPWGPIGNKPPLGSVINGGHPLAEDLVGAWIFNEVGSNTFLNLATPHHGTSTGTSNAWTTGLYGPGLGNGNATGGIDIADEASFDTGINLSVAIGFTLIALPGSNAAPFITKWEDTPTAARSWAICTNSSNQIRVLTSSQTSSGLTVDGQAVGRTLVANTFYHVVFSFDGTNLNLYVNGLLDATAVSTFTGALFNSTIPVQINRANIGAIVNQSNYGVYHYAYIWNNRVLTKADAVQLMLNPYCMIASRQRQFLAKAAAVATTFRFLPLLGAGT